MPDSLLGTVPPQQPIPKHVLVIDDDPMSRELLVLLLEDEGYRVDSTESGELALELLSGGGLSLDIVLADVQLPGISGTQLARKLRRACGRATVLLAMSGSEPPAKAVSLFDGFLLKPFHVEQVAEAAAARKDQPKASRASSVRSRRGKAGSSIARASKAASNKFVDVKVDLLDREAAETAEAVADCGPVLNETIYEQLAVSIPARQLQEMYAMCVKDARERIAGMRRLAVDHDTTRFMREAHSIKGGCGMLGATELHRMAAKLEVAGPGALSTEAREVNFLDELSAACDRLERMLGSRL